MFKNVVGKDLFEIVARDRRGVAILDEQVRLARRIDVDVQVARKLVVSTSVVEL